jgi:hypothetical protein
MTSTESKTKNKLPAPVYAAAGAGDYAYQQLRKLPAKVAELRERVAANEVDLKVDVDRVRAAARRNAAVLASATQAAQERASALYTELVARGEHVVTGTRAPLKVKATIGTEPAAPKPVAKKATKAAEKK